MSNNPDEVTMPTKAVVLLRKLNHDLRNPLNALLATANMLEEGIYEPLTDQQIRAVQRVERTAQRVLTVLEYTISYVKAEEGQYPLTVTTFDPRLTLENVRAECQPIAQEQEIGVYVTTAASVPPAVRSDESVIRRIITELTWNAISFSPRGTVEITSEWSDGWVVKVKDAGPGIFPSAIPNLFEPFWRGKMVGSQVPTSKSGLGLALSHAFAKLLGGQLTFTANIGAGSTFTLCLPMREATETVPPEQS